MYTKITALGGMSQDKYSTQLYLMLYLSLDMPPCAVFFVHTHRDALSNMNVVNCLNPIQKSDY